MLQIKSSPTPDAQPLELNPYAVRTGTHASSLLPHAALLLAARLIRKHATPWWGRVGARDWDSH